MPWSNRRCSANCACRSRLSAQAARAPTVVVVEPDNIVFAEIGAALHLDDAQWHFAGIAQPVPGTGGDVER